MCIFGFAKSKKWLIGLLLCLFYNKIKYVLICLCICILYICSLCIMWMVWLALNWYNSFSVSFLILSISILFFPHFCLFCLLFTLFFLFLFFSLFVCSIIAVLFLAQSMCLIFFTNIIRRLFYFMTLMYWLYEWQWIAPNKKKRLMLIKSDLCVDWNIYLKDEKRKCLFLVLPAIFII